MQKLLVVFSIFLFSFSALAEAKICPECRDADKELKCRRAWKKWISKSKKCVPYKRKARKNRTKTIIEKMIIKETIIREVPKSAPVIVNVTQKQDAPATLRSGMAQKSSQAITAAGFSDGDELKWWNIGTGVYALGLWAGALKDLFTGHFIALSFGLGDRVRIGGMLGYAFSPFYEPHNLLVGGHFGIRLIGRLFLLLTLDSLWADFDGGTVRQRIFAGGIGFEYWPKKWASFSLRINVGYRNQIPPCGEEIGFVTAGNSLALGLHF